MKKWTDINPENSVKIVFQCQESRSDPTCRVGCPGIRYHVWHHQLGRKRLLLLLHPLPHMGEAPNGRIRTSSRIWSASYDALSSSTCGVFCNLHGRSRISCSSTRRDIRGSACCDLFRPLMPLLFRCNHKWPQGSCSGC